MSSSYWRKTKDWSGEVLGSERFAARIRRIKDKDYEKYVKLFVDGTKLELIPPDIYKMDHLEVLWATGNKLTTLPDELTWLTKLQNLRLDRNRFVTLPKCIGRFPMLTHLGLTRNRLKSLPEELANLKNLESLYLSENPDLPPHQNRDFTTKEETQAFLLTLKAPAAVAPVAAAAAAAVPSGAPRNENEPEIVEMKEEDSVPAADAKI